MSLKKRYFDKCKLVIEYQLQFRWGLMLLIHQKPPKLLPTSHSLLSLLRVLVTQFDEYFCAPFILHFPKVFLQNGKTEESSLTTILVSLVSWSQSQTWRCNYMYEFFYITIFSKKGHQYQWRTAFWWSLWCKFLSPLKVNACIQSHQMFLFQKCESTR